MTPQQQTLLTDYLLLHPGKSPVEALCAFLGSGALDTDDAEEAARRLAEAPETLIPATSLESTATAVPKSLLAASAPVEGLETFDHDDVRLPLLKLKQTQTRNADGVPDGQWFTTSDANLYSPMREVVVLGLTKERSLMLPYDGGLAAETVVARIQEKTGVQVPADWQGPVCFSRDRVTPVAQEGIDVLSKDCASCPMNRWRTVEGRRSQDCPESYRLLVFDLTANVPAFYFARGSAIRPTQDMLTVLQAECRRHDRPSFAYSYLVRAKHVDGPDGGYHVPEFGRPLLIEDHDEITFFSQVARFYRGALAVEEGA